MGSRGAYRQRRSVGFMLLATLGLIALLLLVCAVAPTLDRRANEGLSEEFTPRLQAGVMARQGGYR